MANNRRNRFDRSRFVSPEAEDWERESMNRFLTEEKGLDLTENDGEEIRPVLELMEHMHWGEFSQNPGYAVPILVREFYANLDEHTNTSQVRGKTIFFAPKIINRLYGLPNPNDDEVQRLVSRPNLDEISNDRELCPFGVEWTLTPSGRRKWFPTKNLSVVAKILMLFISSRLTPNRNTKEIRPARATLLYAILKQKPINVGRIICKNIKSCRTKKTVHTMYYGSTITKLIAAYGSTPPRDLGRVAHSNIGIRTLRDLGPCIGPDNGQHQMEQPAPGLTEISATLNRMERRIDTLCDNQQNIMNELANIRAAQTEHIGYSATTLITIGNVINNVVYALKLINIPILAPFAFQNMGFEFPVGPEGFQPPQQDNQYFQGEGAAGNVHVGNVAEAEIANPLNDVGMDVGVELEMLAEVVVGAEAITPGDEAQLFDDNTASSQEDSE